MIPWEFHHIGIAVRKLSDSVAFYQNMLGYELVAGPFDDLIQGVTVCFLGRARSNDVTIELVAPLGEKSPVSRFLDRANTAYHLCYQVPDLDGAVAAARKQGCMVISEPVPAVAFQNRRIAWLYAPTRNLVELLEQ